MQLADNEARVLSPAKAFGLLFAVILGLGSLIFLLRPDEKPPPTRQPAATEPTFELTNTEAIARFQQLASLHDRAFADRDPSLLTLIYSPGTEVMATARQEIRQLTDDEVIDETRTERQSVEVVSNGPDEVVIREKVILHPRFLSEFGRDITGNESKLAQTRVWTLSLVNGQWLVQDALVTASEKL